jgi:hypothetical protein
LIACRIGKMTNKSCYIAVLQQFKKVQNRKGIWDPYMQEEENLFPGKDRFNSPVRKKGVISGQVYGFSPEFGI